MRTKGILFIGFVILNLGLLAQTSSRHWLSLETDPITTVFGARTLSFTIEPLKPKHWSWFGNIVRADFPDWMDELLNPKNADKGFDSEISIGGGIGIDYFFKEDREGLYVGLLSLFFEYSISRDQLRAPLLTHNLIPRLGYRWYPWKKLSWYLNPFLGWRYEHSFGKSLELGEQRFLPAGWQPFGTIHLGFHF
ncbi:MAG: hypothetical protein AAF433_13665 [Bacteroidota bacterium]